MCGIGGIVNLDGETPVPANLLEEMGSAMLHRGPDAGGTYNYGQVGLVHRRLKIIDLVTGQQPMLSSDNQVVLVFNGEIYNYKVVRQQLEASGARFRTQSDTEVILEAYRAYGIDCLEHLQGMFAFAIYDRHCDTVFLARDRLGIKPLYYTIDDERMVFASEVRGLVAAGLDRLTTDEQSLGFYLALGYVPHGSTLFRGIRKLPAGHYLLLSGGRLREERYWDLKAESEFQALTEPEVRESFKDRLRETVRSHLMSDVPTGAFLSGGLDSSAIVAMMSECSSNRVRTFSVGYSDDEASNELKFAKEVARRFGTDHYEYNLAAGEFFSSLEAMIEHCEEPIVEAAAIPLLAISRLAREHATVVLSGEGADEVLSGYTSYRTMRWVDRISVVARALPRPMQLTIAKALANSEKTSKYWDWCSSPLTMRYQGVSADLSSTTKAGLYSDRLQSLVGRSVETYFAKLHEDCISASRTQQLMYVDIKSWLSDDLLLKADKMTMAASVELRVPFLDHRLAEFCWRLPERYRVRGSEGKHILKQLMLDYLPRELVYRKKRGFPVPIARWFRESLFERVKEILLDPMTIRRGYFNQLYIERVLAEHRVRQYDHSRRILSLLVLEMWHRHFIDVPVAVHV